jgi:sugar transferase (PEP-CTERM/EpsH1 system associated)
MAEFHRQDAWNALRMARLFRRFRPDIVHTRNWTCLDAIIGARLAGVRVVIQGEHGRDAADPEGRNRLRRRIRRSLAPLVTRYVTVSRDLYRWLVEDVGIPRRKVTQIYNGVDCERFAPADRREARRAAGLPEEGMLIGTVGRLDPVKDYAGLIRAFALLPQAPKSWLVIVGEGPCRADLLGLTLRLGLGDRVRLLGVRDDVPRLLQGLDCFVLSSLGEGIANAILEAMATGLPVVATRVGGNPELVADGGNGLLVPAADPPALAAAMTRYMADPALAAEHGRKGRARAEGEFGTDRMFEAYEALYCQALGSGAIR